MFHIRSSSPALVPSTAMYNCAFLKERTKELSFIGAVSLRQFDLRGKSLFASFSSEKENSSST
jgi:hypothetical protein